MIAGSAPMRSGRTVAVPVIVVMFVTMLNGFPVCACSTTTTCQPSFSRLPWNGSSYDALTETRCRTSKSDGADAVGEVEVVLRDVSVAVVRVGVGRLRQRVRARELQPVAQPAIRRHPQPLVVATSRGSSISVMLPSAAPGRIGLVADSLRYGRTVPPGVVNWLMLIGMRRRSPCDPK